MFSLSFTYVQFNIYIIFLLLDMFQLTNFKYNTSDYRNRYPFVPKKHRHTHKNMTRASISNVCKWEDEYRIIYVIRNLFHTIEASNVALSAN